MIFDGEPKEIFTSKRFDGVLRLLNSCLAHSGRREYMESMYSHCGTLYATDGHIIAAAAIPEHWQGEFPTGQHYHAERRADSWKLRRVVVKIRQFPIEATLDLMAGCDMSRKVYVEELYNTNRSQALSALLFAVGRQGVMVDVAYVKRLNRIKRWDVVCSDSDNPVYFLNDADNICVLLMPMRQDYTTRKGTRY